MYKMMLFIFSVTMALALYGAIRYGFNMIFVYIMLFSALVIAWSVAALISERKEKDADASKGS